MFASFKYQWLVFGYRLLLCVFEHLCQSPCPGYNGINSRSLHNTSSVNSHSRWGMRFFYFICSYKLTWSGCLWFLWALKCLCTALNNCEVHTVASLSILGCDCSDLSQFGLYHGSVNTWYSMRQKTFITNNIYVVNANVLLFYTMYYAIII